MMRIGYLVSDYDAPSHTFVRREVAAVRKMGVQVHCYSIKPSSSGAAVSVLGRSFFRYIIDSVRAVFQKPSRFVTTWLLAWRHRPKGLKGLLWAQFHFLEALTLARLMSAANVDRLHSHFANSGATVAMLSCHYLQIPWSLTLHGISETDYPAGQLLPDKLRRAEFVACASYFMQAQAMRMSSPEVWGKFHIVRCGVPANLLARSPASECKHAVPTLLCVGRLSPEKGHFGLLAAIAALRDEGSVVHLQLIGDGPLAGPLRTEVETLDLNEHVEFCGVKDEDATLDIMTNADIVVLPSLMEGLPVVLIEAFAMAKPVVAAGVAGIPELVQHGTSGLLFAPSDWVALKDQLQVILARRKDWGDMGEVGRNRVANEFTIEETARGMVALFSGSLPE